MEVLGTADAEIGFGEGGNDGERHRGYDGLRVGSKVEIYVGLVDMDEVGTTVTFR